MLVSCSYSSHLFRRPLDYEQLTKIRREFFGRWKLIHKRRFPAWARRVFWIRFYLETQVRKFHMKVILKFANGAQRTLHAGASLFAG
jgi:hypothetical protein